MQSVNLKNDKSSAVFTIHHMKMVEVYFLLFNLIFKNLLRYLICSFVSLDDAVIGFFEHIDYNSKVYGSKMVLNSIYYLILFI